MSVSLKYKISCHMHFKNIDNENKEIVKTGDFNCNMLNDQSNNNANN